MPRVECLQVELSVDEGLLYEGLFLGAFVLSSSCVGVVLCAALAGGSCVPLFVPLLSRPRVSTSCSCHTHHATLHWPRTHVSLSLRCVFDRQTHKHTVGEEEGMTSEDETPDSLLVSEADDDGDALFVDLLAWSPSGNMV